MNTPKLSLVLASASPRRKELLGHLQVPFRILTLNVPEESLSNNPADFCQDIAIAKGNAVFHDLKSKGEDHVYIVSADTIVAYNGKIYGKPSGKEEAGIFLRELAGKSHSVFTAVAIHYKFEEEEISFSFVEESRVTFNPLSEPLLERYLATGDSLDKAGAYGIQGPSLTFISRVEGDYANVVGFPLSRFVNETGSFLQKRFPEEDLWLNLF